MLVTAQSGSGFSRSSQHGLSPISFVLTLELATLETWSHRQHCRSDGQEQFKELRVQLLPTWLADIQYSLPVFNSLTFLSLFSEEGKETAISINIPNTCPFPVWKPYVSNPYTRREKHFQTDSATGGTLKFKSDDFLFPLSLYQVEVSALSELIRVLYLVEKLLRRDV